MSKINSYRDVEIWQRAVDTCVDVHKLTDHFPRSESYGLTSHTRRSDVSFASNIAEGHCRPSRDFARFLTIARGSSSESETQLEIAHCIGNRSSEELFPTTSELSIFGKQLNALHNRIRN